MRLAIYKERFASKVIKVGSPTGCLKLHKIGNIRYLKHLIIRRGSLDNFWISTTFSGHLRKIFQFSYSKLFDKSVFNLMCRWFFNKVYLRATCEITKSKKFLTLSEQIDGETQFLTPATKTFCISVKNVLQLWQEKWLHNLFS